MKRIYFFILISLIPIFSFGQKNKTSKDESLAQELVETYFNELWSDFKTSKIKDVCTKDFIFIQNRVMWYNNSTLDFQKQNYDEIIRLKRQNRIEITTCKRVKNTMWFSYHNYATWTVRDRIIDKSHWFQSAVAVKTKGGWKLAKIHSSWMWGENEEYYPPRDAWDLVLPELITKPEEYLVFSRLESLDYDNDKGFIDFTLKDEKVSVKCENKTCTIELFDKGVSKKIFKNVNVSFWDCFRFKNVYRIKSNKDSLIVIEYYLPEGGTNSHNQKYFVIDKDYHSYYLSSYKGRIVNFNDLDNDGDIDFLKIEEAISPIKFFHKKVEIYHFSLVELKNGKQVRRNSKYDNLAILDCQENTYNSFIITSKGDMKNLKILNPCLKENERKNLRKPISSILIEKE
jgi:hypothetical protein